MSIFAAVLEHLGGEVGTAADAGRTEVELARLRLRERNEVLYGLDRQGRRDDQEVGGVV